MRLITAVTKPPAPHQAPPPRYYSLALPAWAAPGVEPTTSDFRATLRTDMTRKALRQIRSHSTATGR
jgi:hypothetical protein